jgi:hypothetical protein
MGMKVNGTSGLTFPDTTTLASAGQASVRAWVNFNGTGTVAIRASYNVTSITDNNTGEYTVNFTAAIQDANYSTQLTCQGSAGTSRVFGAVKIGASQTASSVAVISVDEPAGVATDPLSFYVAIFR